jgi:hypothetical protein
VEEVIEPDEKGHITKLDIDLCTNSIISKKVILERKGHLSFPVVIRRNSSIYVYPENSAEGHLNIYRYNEKDETLEHVHTLSGKGLTDAIYTDFLSGNFLFTTDADDPNGKKLDQYEWDEQQMKFTYKNSFNFEENIARMAGHFFKVGDKVYRPAQESNNNYGHGLSIQQVDETDDTVLFREVRRLKSPSRFMNVGFHTLNSCGGVTVVDVKGYRHKVLGPIIVMLYSCIKRFIRQ